ncbi:hypothetical protein BSNK01_09720 [Bacillaceae bacterium]
MSYCCGGSMIGASGTLRYFRTYIHEVPILYCPVCNRIEVHPAIQDEYEILAEYAHNDHAPEVNFREYVSEETLENLFENCISIDEGDMESLLKQQIDIALDLLSVAKSLDDRDWQEELKKRLGHLSKRLAKWQRKKSSSY